MGLYKESALEEENLLPAVSTHELSHHLAHVWSAIAQAPFERGVVVVMDGIGETLAAMEKAHATGDEQYMHDLRLEAHPAFVQVPSAAELADSLEGYREAESAYVFEGRKVRRLFKRWIPQRSPSELYNHGFENLESLGALYSRVSSHIFGDWNACGKVMGLAAWADAWAGEDTSASAAKWRHLRATPLVTGRVEGEGGERLQIAWGALESLPHVNGFKPLLDEAGDAVLACGLVEDRSVDGSASTPAGAGGDGLDGAREEMRLDARLEERRAFYAALSGRVQADLEDKALAFCKRLQEATGESNLCFVGGVAQNSVLNGRLAREAGFTKCGLQQQLKPTAHLRADCTAPALL